MSKKIPSILILCVILFVFLPAISLAVRSPDLNGDGKVDKNDVYQLLSAYLHFGRNPEDIDDNTKVNSQDLGYLIANWGNLATNTPTKTPTPIPVTATPTKPPPTITPTLSPKSPGKGVFGQMNCVDFDKLGVSWWYHAEVPKVCGDWLESVPHIKDPYHWQQIKTGQRPLGGNSNYIIGFNECDRPDQCNLPAELAVPIWREIELTYPSKKLVAPSASELDVNWIVRFRNNYISRYGEPPRFTALNAHCYNLNGTCESIIDQHIALAQQWGIPEVWITEYSYTLPCGGAANYTRALPFIGRMENYFKNHPIVTHHAWFVSQAPSYNEFYGCGFKDENGWTPLGLEYMKY